MGTDDLDIAELRRRRGAKWARCPEDVLPAWVADMDFPVADPVARVLSGMVAASDLGYPVGPDTDGLPSVFARRMQRRFDWDVDPARAEVLTDVVQGMYLAIEVFSSPGDALVTPLPIYPPFLEALRETGRRPVWMRYVGDGSGRFRIDFERLREEMVPQARILLLCNPHNPTGRALDRGELERVAALAVEHDLVIVSDEIHSELVYPGFRHIPIATLGPEVAARTITLTSATKAFNIAGLRCAVAAFGSERLHSEFLRVPRHARGGIGSLGMAATAAAWSGECDAWQDDLMRCLERNRALVAEAVSRWTGALHEPPDATYLAWIDLEGSGLGPVPQRTLLDRARVMLSDGADFGEPGRGFVRLNLATSREILAEILARVGTAMDPGPRPG